MDITNESSEFVENAVNEMDFLPEQKMIILEIFEWVKRMTEKYGPMVYSKSGEQFDWGQALCREQFGNNWQQHMITHNIQLPIKEDLERAIEWENGNIPDWVKT